MSYRKWTREAAENLLAAFAALEERMLIPPR
jgi:hypothetical protein